MGVKVVLLSFLSTSANCDIENPGLFEKKRCSEMLLRCVELQKAFGKVFLGKHIILGTVAL